MDDNGNIAYYIVLGIIYLLSRVFGKKKKKQQPVKRAIEDADIEAPTASKEPEPSLSFDDILRELSGESKPKPVVIPASQPAPSIVPKLEEEINPAYQYDEIDEIAVDYQVPKPIGYKPLPEPNLISKKKKKNVYGRMGSFIIEEQVTVDYLEDFYTENGAAKAFVLSEIFARKY